MRASRLSCVLALPFLLALAAPAALAQGTTPAAKPEPPRPGEAAKQVEKAQKADKVPEKAAPEAKGDAAAAASPGDEAVPAALTSLPSEVLMLRAVGPWKTADAKGFVRLVALAQDNKLDFYVQWIDDSGKVVETKRLEGADQAPQLALADIRVETGEDESSVYLDTPKDAQGFSQTYVLVLGEPGKAQFGPATN
jgi:hypothetical protein